MATAFSTRARPKGVNMNSIRKLALAAALAASSLSASAELFARPGGMVYDSTQDITWLQNWNTNGQMDWTTANSWADNLVFGGYDDWRLPTALSPDGSGPCVNNCTVPELRHMFYTEFGATAGASVLLGSNTANLALFNNLQPFLYWSGTAYAPDPRIAWFYSLGVGSQGIQYKPEQLYAVAIRTGDVAAVPEPQGVVLLLAGLIGLAVMRRMQAR